MMKNLISTIILILLANQTFGQIKNNDFFSQYDYEIAHYIGKNSNSIKKEIGEPYFTAILDSTKLTRIYYYKVIVNKDTIDFQLHYDQDLVCNAFSFMVNKDEYHTQIENLMKGYVQVDKWLVTPNRFLVTKTVVDNKVFILYNTTIYPIILAQLSKIQRHLKNATTEYSNYDLEQAERDIKELYKSVLAASAINNITQNEFNILVKIYKSYMDIINYDRVKIPFIQYNSNVYFTLIPNDIEKLKHESVDEVDFSEITNLIQF